MNCSPSSARMRFSQQREASPLRSRTIHLPAVAVRLVLPHRLDAVLEEVEVGVRLQVARPRQVRVERPELLAGGEAADAAQAGVEVVAGRRGGAGRRRLGRGRRGGGRLAAEPQAVARLQPVLARRQRGRQRLKQVTLNWERVILGRSRLRPPSWRRRRRCRCRR